MLKYELVVVEDIVTVILSFVPDKEVTLSHVASLVDGDKLTHTPGHRFNLKLAYQTSGEFLPDKFAVQWSPDLAAMLPELAGSSLPANGSDSFLPFVTNAKCEMDNKLECAVEAWKKRSKVILNLASRFQATKELAVCVDYTTMTSIDLVFRTENKAHVLTVSLYTNAVSGGGRISCKTQSADGQKKELKLNEFTDQDLAVGDLCEVLKTLRAGAIAKDD